MHKNCLKNIKGCATESEIKKIEKGCVKTIGKKHGLLSLTNWALGQAVNFVLKQIYS